MSKLFSLFVLTLAVLSVGCGEAESDTLIEDQLGLAVQPSGSGPLYVIVSTDWDKPDTAQELINLMEDLRRTRHPDIRYTHFFGPYTYTSPSVSVRRKAELKQYLLGSLGKGDEIGLHIHPYHHFVTQARVPYRSGRSISGGEHVKGYERGWPVLFSEYTQAEQKQLLLHAKHLFVTNLGVDPHSFRAGGWAANHKTMAALAETGFTVDSSAVPLHYLSRIPLWSKTARDVLAQSWSKITVTSQPHRLNGVLEVPDNSALVEYPSTAEMIQNFHAIRKMNGARVFQIGFHPDIFSSNKRDKIDAVLDEVDKYLERHGGPVVYTTLNKLNSKF